MDSETMRRKVRELEEREHLERVIAKERQESTHTGYGEDVLARVRAYEKSMSEKNSSEVEKQVGALKELGKGRLERFESRKDDLLSRARKVER